MDTEEQKPKFTHGGFRPGAGRPRMPKRKRLCELLSVRFTPAELAEVRRKAKDAGMPLASFIRDRALKG